MKASAGHDFLICSHTDILRDCLRQASRFHSRWIYSRCNRILRSALSEISRRGSNSFCVQWLSFLHPKFILPWPLFSLRAGFFPYESGITPGAASVPSASGVCFRQDRFFLMQTCFMPPPAARSAAAQRMHLEPDALDLGGPVRRGDLVNDVLRVDHRKQVVDQRIRDRVVLVDF